MEVHQYLVLQLFSAQETSKRQEGKLAACSIAYYSRNWSAFGSTWISDFSKESLGFMEKSRRDCVWLRKALLSVVNVLRHPYEDARLCVALPHTHTYSTTQRHT